jgi:hypothetical protein
LLHLENPLAIHGRAGIHGRGCNYDHHKIMVWQ